MKKKQKKKMHDTLQLTNACKRDPFISTTFQGVHAADQIPFQKLHRLPAWSIIMNTDPHNKPGQHWVAAMKKDGVCYFFDSYGDSPLKYNPQLWKPLQRCIRNKKDYQQTLSTVCGDYCLFFLRLFNLKDFPADFQYLDEYLDENDDEANDNFIYKTVHEWFPAILNKELHDQLLTTPVARGQKGGFQFLNQISVSRSRP